MFKDTYNFFGQDLICIRRKVNKTFVVESDVDHFIKKIFKGWKYIKVDTVNQIGFPDNLLMKDSRYILIESKMLKKKELNVLEDDLKWQPGQLPFMKQALMLGLSYKLVVAKGNTLAYIMDKKQWGSDIEHISKEGLCTEIC